MRINIGPYKNWIGPYQISEMLLFWLDKDDDRVYNFGKWLAGGDGKDSVLMNLCNWIESKRKRKVKVKIDCYDTWDMFSTLAIIILPMLKQLKETKHGSPMVNPEDVPEYLRIIGDAEGYPQSQFEFENHEEYVSEAWDITHKRWEWVLDEIIWTFEQLQPDYNWENQYWKTHPELDLAEYPEDEGKIAIPLRWKVKGECDLVGLKNHQKRIDNGLRLFGVYFQGLWD